MQIAQIAPLTEAIPPKLYGGTERVISWLTDETSRPSGMKWFCFASGDSRTSAHLESCWPKALRLDGSVRDPNALHIANARASLPTGSRFRFVALPSRLLSVLPVFPSVHTICDHAHGRLDLPEHHVVFARFSSIPVISISDTQRRPVPNAGWIRTIHHGLPERLLTPQSVRPAYFAFLGRVSPGKGC